MAKNEQKILRVTFKGVGPLTRSTVGNDMPDPDEQAISDTLHWIWNWQVQLERLLQSTDEKWSIDHANKSGLECRKIYSRTSFDVHMLLVVGRNLLRAIDRLPKKLAKPAIFKDTRKSLILLRDIYEHSDEQRESFQNSAISKQRAGKTLSDKFPCTTPWAITYSKNGFYMAWLFELYN